MLAEASRITATFTPEPGTLRVVLRDPGSYELEAADLPAATTVALRPIR